MYGRYRRTTSEEEIARQYHIPIPPQLDLPITYNIALTENVLAIRRHPETNRNVVKRGGGEYLLLGCENLDPDQVQRLKAACEVKLY